MEILFLGTGAADWNVADFVEGTEYRRWSSTLIDGELLIDPGPHIFHFAETIGRPELYNGIKNVIITHSHGDHFNPQTVLKLSRISAPTFYGDAGCLRKLQGKLTEDELSEIKFVSVECFEEVELGKFHVTSLPSNHLTSDPDEKTRNYMIEAEGKRIFYGLDGAWMFTAVWNKLRGLHFDAMILELTMGDLPGNYRNFSHTSIPMLEIMLATFRENGCLNADSAVYCSHMAKALHADHKSLIARLAPLGVTPAYDGFSIKI